MALSFVVGSKCFNNVLDKIKILSVKNGSLKAEYKISEDDVDENLRTHNGFSATAVDVLTSVGLRSILPKDTNFVSVDMHFSFMESARLGDEIIVETKTLKKGKTLCFMEAVIRNKLNNNLLVKGGQVVYLLDKR